MSWLPSSNRIPPLAPGSPNQAAARPGSVGPRLRLISITGAAASAGLADPGGGGAGLGGAEAGADQHRRRARQLITAAAEQPQGPPLVADRAHSRALAPRGHDRLAVVARPRQRLLQVHRQSLP